MEEPKQAPEEQAANQAPAPVPAQQSNQSMDVVAPPQEAPKQPSSGTPVAQPTDQPPVEQQATEQTHPETAHPEEHHAVHHDGGLNTVVVAAIIIVIALAALTVFAYLKTQSSGQ